RHGDCRRVDRVEQVFQSIERLDTKLLRHRGRTLWTRFEESDESRARYVTQNAHVMIAERASSDDADPDIRLFSHDGQITSPRSLRSRKLRNSSTSGYRCSSSSARSRACDRFKSELKNSRYARLSSRCTSSETPFRCRPTLFKP